MTLDAATLTVVHTLEHKVRHLLGLYAGLARRMLLEIPDSDAELRRVVGLHESGLPELTDEITTLFQKLTLPQPGPPPPAAGGDPRGKTSGTQSPSGGC